MVPPLKDNRLFGQVDLDHKVMFRIAVYKKGKPLYKKDKYQMLTLFPGIQMDITRLQEVKQLDIDRCWMRTTPMGT